MYVESGDVQFGYFHFPFLGPESLWSAEASECAADQDAFWEYHDYLWANHGGENQGAFNKENLKEFAAELDLDTDAFNECLDSGKYTEQIQNDGEVARSLGVTSTPAFIINGQPVLGAQPFEVFQEIIESELANTAQ